MASQLVRRLIDRRVGWSLDPSVNQSVSKSTEWFIGQSDNHSAGQSIGQSADNFNQACKQFFFRKSYFFLAYNSKTVFLTFLRFSFTLTLVTNTNAYRTVTVPITATINTAVFTQPAKITITNKVGTTNTMISTIMIASKWAKKKGLVHLKWSLIPAPMATSPNFSTPLFQTRLSRTSQSLELK